MEIDGKSSQIDLSTRISRLDVQESQTTRLHRVGREASDAGTDRVELSTRSREMQSVEELIRSTPDVREGKVEQIRRSIESGTYNVRAEQVADKIIGGSLIDEIF